MQKKIFSYLDEQHAYVIKLQQEMTRRKAVGPDSDGDGERTKADYILGELQNIGLVDISEINAPDERVSSGNRPNIVARIAGRKPQTLWLIGHLDVVPAGDERLWDSPPYELHQEGDFLFGRGVEDNQQAIVSSMLVLKALKEHNITPDIGLGVLMVADEETHSDYGLKYILKTAPNLISQDDLVIIPDFGDAEGVGIEIAEKSCAWVKVTITGKQCHASTPDKGVNSLIASAACILALNDLYQAFPQIDVLYNPPVSTFVPSKKEANVENINTVPGLDVFYFDCRVLPEIPLTEVLKKAQELVDIAAAQFGASAKVEAVHLEQAPQPTAKDAPIVRRLLRSLKAVRGVDGKPNGIGGQTVAAPLRQLGIPAAVWCTILSNAHTPNEKSSIKNTIADAKIFYNLLFDE